MRFARTQPTDAADSSTKRAGFELWLTDTLDKMHSYFLIAIRVVGRSGWATFDIAIQVERRCVKVQRVGRSESLKTTETLRAFVWNGTWNHNVHDFTYGWLENAVLLA